LEELTRCANALTKIYFKEIYYYTDLTRLILFPIDQGKRFRRKTGVASGFDQNWFQSLLNLGTTGFSNAYTSIVIS